MLSSSLTKVKHLRDMATWAWAYRGYAFGGPHAPEGDNDDRVSMSFLTSDIIQTVASWLPHEISQQACRHPARSKLVALRKLLAS